LHLVHPCLHILSILALIVDELPSERKRILSASIAIDPDKLEKDRLSTTGFDIEEVDMSSED